MWVDHREEQLSDLEGVGVEASLGGNINLTIGPDLSVHAHTSDGCVCALDEVKRQTQAPRRGEGPTNKAILGVGCRYLDPNI